MPSPLYELTESDLKSLDGSQYWIPDISTLEVGAPNPFEASCQNTPGDLARIHGVIFQSFFSIDEDAAPKRLGNKGQSESLLLMHLANCLQHLVASKVGLKMTHYQAELTAERSDELSKQRNEFSYGVHGMLSSKLATWCPDLYRTAFQMYLDAGYLDVNDLFVVPNHTKFNGATPLVLLEKAVVDQNVAAACILIENGADLARVPAETSSFSMQWLAGGDRVLKVVKAGDFSSFVDARLGETSPMSLAIKASVMNREILAAQSHLKNETDADLSAASPRRKVL